MNTSRCLTTLSRLFVLIPSLFAQGPLAPTGTPAPSMKTLEQIEPRTPIFTVPAIINAPGSYYLTRNINTIPATIPVITINSSDVTIDLNGFTLFTDVGTGTVTNHSAFFLSGTGLENITVRNGTIHGAWYAGFWAFEFVENIILENLRVVGTFRYGLKAGEHAKITGCVVDGTASNLVGFRGIQANSGSEVRDCVASRCGGRGYFVVPDSQVLDCTAYDNGSGFTISGKGLYSRCIADCVSSDNNIGFDTGDYARLDRCTAYSNTRTGADLSQFSSATGCLFSENGGSGLIANAGNVVSVCSAYHNTLKGFALGVNATITGCTATRNQGDGIEVLNASVVANCAAYESGKMTTNALADGIQIGDGCRMVDCASQGNQGAGIFVTSTGNLISGNITRSNTGDGIHTASSDNLIFGNISGNNSGTDIDFEGIGKIGPVSASAIGADPHANF